MNIFVYNLFLMQMHINRIHSSKWNCWADMFVKTLKLYFYHKWHMQQICEPQSQQYYTAYPVFTLSKAPKERKWRGNRLNVPSLGPNTTVEGRVFLKFPGDTYVTFVEREPWESERGRKEGMTVGEDEEHWDMKEGETWGKKGPAGGEKQLREREIL